MKIIHLLSPVLAAAMLCQAGASTAQDKSNSTGVMLAVPLHAVPGRSAAEVQTGASNIARAVIGQPGLIEQHVLENQDSNGVPRFVHVMRWKSIDDWSRMFGENRFQIALRDNTAVTFDAARLFKPAAFSQ
ncbi:MAG: hypothetical protein LCI02_22685 [Proteobacteria bacterium]|nr:hypothetical protein [Pseudomonadota bacterium]